jgi:hypothetical protein
MTQNPNFLLILRFHQPVAIGSLAEVPARSKYSAAARNAVPIQNLNPDVLMMEPAEDRYRRDTADLLRPAKIWSVFVQ